MLEKYQDMLKELKKQSRGPAILDRMEGTLKVMKNNLILLGNTDDTGKHSYENRIRELENIIERKDREIIDIKEQCIKEFEHIKNLCFCNDYGGQLDNSKKLSKIYEIAEDNIYALVKDMEIDEMIDEEAKIIELTTTETRTSSIK